MRLARLPAENPRTQGPERRAWYRRHNPEHLRQVEALIAEGLRARAPTVPARAVLLGAGACTELPLEHLARELEAIQLVDVDVPGMARARDGLAAALRPKVDLLQADLTGGVSASLAAALRTQPWDDLRALSPGAALDAAATCLERCPVPDPPAFPDLPSAGFGVVVSSLLLTQLFSLPLLDVLDTLNLRAPTAADRREESARYTAAAHDFRRRICLAHLSLLLSLLAPGGVALLITDVVGYLIPPRAGPHARDAIESFPTLPEHALAIPRDLETVFPAVSPPRRWSWLATAPTADAHGRRYDVVGVLAHVS